MIRSNRSVRKISSILVLMLAVAFLAPAAASAQSVSPTDEQYQQGVFGAASGGSGEDPGSSAGSVSELPFTGLDVAAIALIGIGLVGAGFAIHRASRAGKDQPLA